MKFFNTSNKEALTIVETYKNVIYSYLEAVPDSGTTNFNHITTIPLSERTNENGHSNFKFGYNEFVSDIQKRYTECNVRIETGAFGSNFAIKASKASSIQNADLIVFTTPSNPNVLYIADKSRNDNNKWLTDRGLRTVEFTTFTDKETGKQKTVTYFMYDINTLWSLGHITKVYFDSNTVNNSFISILHNDYVTRTNKQVKTEKKYYDYHIDTSHIKFVQYDAKDAYVYFFGYKGYKYTNMALTIPMMIDQWIDYTDLSGQAFYHKLYRVLKKNIDGDKVYSCKIKLTKIDNTIDPSILNENNELEIYVTTSPDYCISEHTVENKTADMKAYQRTYQKTYQKVIMYLKRHNNQFNPKWNRDELEIADKYLSK